MIYGVSINHLYGHHIMDNILLTIRYSILYLGSIMVSNQSVIYTTITMKITYETNITHYIVFSFWGNTLVRVNSDIL